MTKLLPIISIEDNQIAQASQKVADILVTSFLAATIQKRPLVVTLGEHHENLHHGVFEAALTYELLKRLSPAKLSITYEQPLINQPAQRQACLDRYDKIAGRMPHDKGWGVTEHTFMHDNVLAPMLRAGVSVNFIDLNSWQSRDEDHYLTADAVTLVAGQSDVANNIITTEITHKNRSRNWIHTAESTGMALRNLFMAGQICEHAAAGKLILHIGGGSHLYYGSDTTTLPHYLDSLEGVSPHMAHLQTKPMVISIPLLSVGENKDFTANAQKIFGETDVSLLPVVFQQNTFLFGHVTSDADNETVLLWRNLCEKNRLDFHPPSP